MGRALGTIALLAGLALVAGVSGCLGEEADPAAPSDAGEDQARIELPTRGASGTGAVNWSGAELSAGEGEACPSRACERVPFNVTGGDLPGELVVSATWDPYRVEDRGAASPGRLNVTVETPSGTTVEGDALLWSAAAVVEDPEPGAYVATVRAEGGSTAYVGAVQLQDAPAENGSKRPLLPDLVTMPLVHLTQERPVTSRGYTVGGTGAVDDAAGARGCSPYETAQRDAQNCLRFTNSIGNVGQGPLEVRLSFENATRALAPAVEGRFTQAVYHADGSVRQVDAGGAEYHLAHEHYHKEGMATFTLHAYDNATGARGEVVQEGKKSSWCLVDMGLVEPGGGHRTTRPRYPLGSPGEGDWSRNPREGGSNCEAATPEDPMVTGVSAGWYDMYEWFMPDQYVEVTDLPEGTYELVSRANPDGTVLEADTTNNAGGVVFEWADGEIRVLERWSEAFGDR